MVPLKKNNRTISVFILVILSTLFCEGQDLNFFEVKNPRCGVLGLENEGFKLTIKNEPTTVCSYSPSVFQNLPENLLLAMARELLKFEGDTRVCVLKIIGYNNLRSQIYLGHRKSYTLQLEALLMINQIILNNPFNYSSHPLLFNKLDSTYIYGEEIDMREIYQLYNNWLRKVETLGIEKINEMELLPLDGSIYKWY